MSRGLQAILVVVVLVAVAVGIGALAASGGSSSSCEALPDPARSQLSDAVRPRVLGEAKAVRSNDFAHVYFVAANVEGSTALFAMNRLDGYSLIYSENDHAHAVSGMGRGQDTVANISESDDGAQEAVGCL